jgi:hypothetical protein
MQTERLSRLIEMCRDLRGMANARGDAVAFKKLDHAALRLSAAQSELRRGNERAARAFAWSACDLLSLIHV